MESAAKKARHVQATLGVIEAPEPDREGQRQQESEEDLHTEPGDAQLLQQVAEIAPVPLLTRLRSRHEVAPP